MPPSPKPERRVHDPAAGRAKVALEGRCRACGHVPRGHLLDFLNRAHLVAKGQGGDDVACNIVPLCGSGTTGCHGKLTDHSRGWLEVAAALRRNLQLDEVEYILRKKGADWLDRVYPQRETLA
jgi:hypothetical protein